MVEGAPGQQMQIGSIMNLRDIGGWATPDGPVRRGVVFRSAELPVLSGPDLDAFEQLGIRTAYDLRTADESAASPAPPPPGVEHIAIDILQDAGGAAPAQIRAALDDPVAAAEVLGDGKAVAIFEDAYAQIVGLPSALVGYRQLFTELASNPDRPVLVHCTMGKDRTGWAAAALLLLLGVDQDDVMAEYLLTDDQLLPALQPWFDHFTSIGIGTDLIGPVFGVRPEYLDAALASMSAQFGSIDGYFGDGLGLDPDAIATLRHSFVVRD